MIQYKPKIHNRGIDINQTAHPPVQVVDIREAQDLALRCNVGIGGWSICFCIAVIHWFESEFSRVTEADT